MARESPGEDFCHGSRSKSFGAQFASRCGRSSCNDAILGRNEDAFQNFKSRPVGGWALRFRSMICERFARLMCCEFCTRAESRCKGDCRKVVWGVMLEFWRVLTRCKSRID